MQYWYDFPNLSLGEFLHEVIDPELDVDEGDVYDLSDDELLERARQYWKQNKSAAKRAEAQRKRDNQTESTKLAAQERDRNH
jgi:hypothetical protein